MTYWTDDRRLDMDQRRLDAAQEEARRKMSIYGEPHPDAATWTFAEQTEGRHDAPLTGRTETIRATTEMEAIDRLFEAYPDLGPVKVISRKRAEQKED